MKNRLLLLLFMAVATTMSAQNATITYVSDGQVYATIDQEVGEYYNVPAEDPYFNDFLMCVFAGWSTTEDGTPQFINENSKVSGDVTLYARFAMGSFQKGYRYELLGTADELTLNTEFAICAHHDNRTIAVNRYAAWHSNAVPRDYSGAAFGVADEIVDEFRTDYYDHLFWFKYDGEGGLTSNDYVMCHDFGQRTDHHYLGYATYGNDSWGDLYGYKSFNFTRQSDGSYAIQDSRYGRYLTFFPDKYVPTGAEDMGIYFAFADEPYYLHLYKKITEISTDGATFVATSDHYDITFNIVDDPGVDIYVDGKEGNYAVGDMKSGFKCMKGQSGTFSYSFWGDTEANLVASWTTSDGKYTNYKGRSITLSPDQDITVTVEFVEVEKSVVINGEVYPIGGEPIELFKGQVVIDGDNVVLNDAYLEGPLDLTFGGATLVVNGDCTVSGGIVAEGELTIAGSGVLNVSGPKGIVSKSGGMLSIYSAVDINIIPDEGIKKAPAKRGKGDEDFYPPFAIAGFDDVHISNDYFLVAPCRGYYDAKSQVFMTAEGSPAQALRTIARRTLDVNGDGTLSILDINILVEALLSEDTGKDPEKK